MKTNQENQQLYEIIFYIETAFIVDICCNVDTIKTKRR